jgi:hypothetical protein
VGVWHAHRTQPIIVGGELAATIRDETEGTSVFIEKDKRITGDVEEALGITQK